MQKFIPILFNTEMITALLEGKKIQTRRIVKPIEKQIEKQIGFKERLDYNEWKVVPAKDTVGKYEFRNGTLYQPCYFKCPYGVVGDVLWVRETFTIPENKSEKGYYYKADNLQLPIRGMEHLNMAAVKNVAFHI